MSRRPRPTAVRVGAGWTALRLSTVAVGLWALAGPAVAAGPDAERAAGIERWVIDGDASEAEFRTRVFAVITISGRFDRVHGQIDIDRARGAARIDTAVDLTSLAMDSAAHADWALSPAFFDADRHPEARFRADDVPLDVLASGGVLYGQLTLRGVRRPVAFRLLGGDCPLDPARPCALALQGSVRRTEFGMRAERHAVADRVQLRIAVGGRAADGASAGGASGR